MSVDKKDNPEQIPSSHNEGQIKGMISEQGGVQGERKEVDVKDYPRAAAIAQVLKDMEFPANKKEIIDKVEMSSPQDNEILSDIQRIEDRQYQNVSDVTKAAGLVRQ